MSLALSAETDLQRIPISDGGWEYGVEYGLGHADPVVDHGPGEFRKRVTFHAATDDVNGLGVTN